MNVLSIEERRHLVLTAKLDSLFAHKYPALVETGQRIVRNRWDTLIRLCNVNPGCSNSGESPCLAITPLIKPVGDDCNLRCRYCSSRPEKTTGRQMSYELLERIIMEIIPRSPLRVDFIFHGGEPLMAGIEFFKKAVELQKKYTRPQQIVQNHVQTNGTLVNKEWAQFFADHNFFVGVSLDGPAVAHDAHRVWMDGIGSHESVMNGVALLLSAGVKLQGIAVVPPNPQVGPQELLDFMQISGIPRWRVNHCRTTASISTYPDYMLSLFDEWVVKPGVCEIGLFSEVIEGLLGYPATTCWMTGSCLRFIGFDPDGTVSPCCEMVVPPECFYGNILNKSLDSILAGPVAKWFHAEFNKGIHNCADCDWHHMCGGCTYMRVQFANTPSGSDPLCKLYQGVFTILSQRFDEILRLNAVSESIRTNG